VAVRFVPCLALSAVAVCGVTLVQAAVPYGPGALVIVVRDAKGQGVVGALVAATGPVTREATTLAGGIVILQALPLGAYDVSVTKAGYTPVDTTAVASAASTTPKLLALRLVPADFASATAAAATLSANANPAEDPFVAHALAAAPGVVIVPNSRGRGSAAVLGGTTPLESRVELDGIPVAGGFSGVAALRFRSALGLDAVDIAPGLATFAGDTPLNTIGGRVNYRTASFGSGFTAGAQAGYDSSFGSFQLARYSQTFGPVSVLTDLVTGGGQTRSQIFKAQYAFSPATSLGVSSYGSQATAPVGDQNVTSVAPAAAIDLKTAFGRANLEARTYRSSSRTTATPGDVASASDDRILGTQLNIDVPAGAALVSLGFDRRAERATLAGTTLARTYSTVSARAAIPLGRTLRFELLDAYGGGTQLHRRHDPQAALTYGAAGLLTLRLSAGSAYATLPLDTLVLLPIGERDANPETSFGYRLAANVRLDGNDRLWGAVSAQRRFNTLAARSQAKSRGLEIGFERTAERAGFGALAYLDVQRAYGFGAFQPFARAFTLPSSAGEQIPGDAYSKARLAVSYRVFQGIALRLGATFLGANNAFTGRAFALGDVSLSVPLGGLVQARFGIENAFGHPIRDSMLAGEYAPHEITFSLGRR